MIGSLRMHCLGLILQRGSIFAKKRSKLPNIAAPIIPNLLLRDTTLELRISSLQSRFVSLCISVCLEPKVGWKRNSKSASVGLFQKILIYRE